MKRTTILLCLGLVGIAGLVSAQRIPINNVSQDQAITIASHLRSGMTESEVVKKVDDQHGLQSGGDVGGRNTGWTRFYALSNGCSLDLRFDPKGLSTNFQLSAAWIANRTGEKVVSIALTNAP